MSRSLLAQGSRHLPPWLIFDVRQIDPFMKSTPTYTTGRRCAIAQLLRPAGDRNQKAGGLLATAKVALRSYGQAQMRQPASRCATRPSLIAHGALSESNPGERRLARQSRRGTVISEPHQPEKQTIETEPNKAMELTRMLVTDRAVHALRQASV